MHNSCLGISPKYLIFQNAHKPIIDLCGISFLCANFETFTIFSAIVLKTCPYPPYYLSHHSLAVAYVYFFTSFTSTNCTRVRIRQILQPAGTSPFLRNLAVSPVRHAELEQEDIGITQLIETTLTHKMAFLGILMHLFPRNVTSMSGILFLLFVQSLFQFGAKEGK